MSEHDDTLLDEDLGDEEYDLGNDEEEALLADDYELERQNSYKGEEETDDVLDLGVTDALDDLDGEDENLEFSRSKTDKHIENDFYKDGKHPEVQSAYYEQDENNGYKKEQTRPYEGNSACDSVTVSNNIGKGDLREKLQKNSQKVYVGNGQGLEDDDCEEAKERRNRFQNERTMISPKMNNDIPDTLENVVTSESSRPSSFRGRGRGRATRGYRGGGRFSVQTPGNFNPRFGAARNTTFENQQPVCRPPLLETRPPFLLGVPNNVQQNQQILYQQNNPPVQPFQQFSPNGPAQGPTSFVDNRPQFNPNQFQAPVGPRTVGPRLDYGPRGSVPGSIQGPAYNCPPNQPPYLQIQPAPFQNPGSLIQESQVRPLQNNQGLLLHGNTGGSLLGNPLVPGNAAPLLQGSQALPMQGFPRQQTPSQGPPIQNIPNAQMPSQPPFENRPSFQEPHFDGRPPYDSRSSYSDQVPSSQFNNSNTLPLPQQPTSNIPSVPLPPGHKILINPHFRGAVQPTNDAARLVWDSQNPALVQSQLSGNQFSQSQASYQNQPPFNQSQQGPLQFQQSNYQQNKNDDPYAYFSDVWQENRPQKTQSISPSKQYTLESNYSRESNYNDCGSKYKSESQWEQRDSYQEDRRSQQSYRERDLPPRPRNDHMQKSRSSSSSVYRGDSYDQSHNQRSPSGRSMNPAIRGVNRIPQKRVSDPSERGLRDTSPKRMKPNNANLQEVKTVDTLNDVINEKKDEDNDPEMQEYRKKMEEQKRLREKILREKENRRKMAAMEKQNEEIKNEASATAAEGSQQDTKPVSVLMGVVKDAAINKGRPGAARGRGRPVNAQTTEATERTPGVRIVRTIQTVQSNEQVDPGDTKDENSAHAGGQSNDAAHTKQLTAQSGTRRVVIQKPLANSQKIATTIQKTVSNLQKGQGVAQHKLAGNVQSMTQKTQNQQAALKKPSAFGQKVVGTQRMIAQKAQGNLQKTVINVHEVASANAQKVVVTTQNNQRVVLQKASLQPKKLPEIKTNTVRLENLAASTSEAQIRRMCQGIGTIESIHMGEGSATIVFKTQSAAMVFHKKYQRKMLDLSLITVRLVPQTGGNKAVTAVAKKS